MRGPESVCRGFRSDCRGHEVLTGAVLVLVEAATVPIQAVKV